ncbi:hypothetical protein Pcinc_036671 [Petrolisthes cinctipes]|uniref:Sorting nexin-29 n=1 Tax=Petrolisthes cinctipes TaxID=88211 RepID=A0AAE1BUJ8_PETCI|nr:hypothetical protein Pcinc_036671 [Petrolisthes cinctipes]
MSSTCDTDSYNSKREELLAGLLSAVQQCQVRFGGRAELATESDERVAGLCERLEATLSHGLKLRSPGRGLAAIKQMTDRVTSGLSLHLSLPSPETETPVLWWYVRELLTRHEYERFLVLRCVSTDLGRGRAWLRSLLNEHALERYMHILGCEEGILQQWFEPWALLRDQERAAMLPNLAAGLDSILFAINIDNPELNGPSEREGGTGVCPTTLPAVATQEPEAHIAPTTTDITSSRDQAVSSCGKKRELRKKRRKIPSQLISFDDDFSRPEEGQSDVITTSSPLYHSAPTTCLSSPSPANPASATPYADRLEKLVHLRELQLAKEALKSSSSRKGPPASDADSSEGLVPKSRKPEEEERICTEPEEMGNSNSGEKTKVEECLKTLDDNCDVLSINLHHDDKNYYDGDSLEGSSYNQLFESLLPIDPISTQLVNKSERSPLTSPLTTAAPQPITQVRHQQQRPNSLYDQETGSYKSNQSNLSADSFPSSSDGEGNTVFTPVGVGGGVSLIPVTRRGLVGTGTIEVGSGVSDDENSINSYTQEGDDGGGGREKTINTTSPTSLTSTLPSSSSGETTLTMDELRSAVLELSRARDLAESRRTEVAAALAQEMETSSGLRVEMAHLHSNHQDILDKLNARTTVLTRENELLRHQLKKYVGAVQLLRRENSLVEGGVLSSTTTITSSSSTGPAVPPLPPEYRDYHNEAAAYQSKLIQVAEMHGELMEFNERLHRLLRLREAQVKQLREQLIELRGPLPEGEEGDGVSDEVLVEGDGGEGSDGSPSPSASSPRRLINIWIPTAFLTGSSSDTHHVYQIYVRIGDEEWNVYRRYAQFHAFHRALSRSHQAIRSFTFPQKKTFGYKDESVVEERRVRLQTYLRRVVNLLTASHPSLTHTPDKPTLTTLLPFFSDVPVSQDNSSGGSGSSSRNKSSRRSGVLSRFSNPPIDPHQVIPDTPQYNGL